MQSVPLIAEFGASDIILIWGLEDAIRDGTTIDEKRDILEREYPLTLNQTRALVTTAGNAQNLAYAGQKHYFVNDGMDSLRKEHVMAHFGEPNVSNSAIRRVSGEIAVQATHMADAWGYCISQAFPHSLRVSVHPYPAHFQAKMGIYMTQTREEWVTPWHGVAVLHTHSNEWELMHRYRAEELNAKLVMKNGRPTPTSSQTNATLLSKAQGERISPLAARKEQMMIVHIVLFKWNENSSSAAINAAIEGLRNLKDQVPDILSLTCGENINPLSRGYTHGLVVQFFNQLALDVYRPHPAHQKVVKERIEPICADILAVDYTV